MSDPERHEEQPADKKAESRVKRIIGQFRRLWRAIKRHRWKTAIVTFAGLVVLIGGHAANLWRTVFPLVPGLVKAVEGIPVIWPQGKPLDLSELQQRALIAVVTKNRKEIESEKSLKPQYLLQLGNAERSLGHYADAKRYYELGLKRAEERKNETNAFSKKLYRLLGMLGLADEQTDEKNEAAALFNLASLQLEKTGEPDEALKNAGKVLEIHRKEAMTGDTANDLALLGEILSKKREYRKAIGVLKEAMKQYQESGEFDRVADMKSAIGEAYLGAGNLDSALTELKQASKQHQAGKDNKSLAKDLFLIGTIYRRQDKRELALDYFRQARKIFAEQHSEEEGKALYRMGSIYIDMGEPGQALQMLRASAGKLKDTGLEAQIYFNIGMILSGQGNCETGLEYMKKALRMAKESDDHVEEANVLHHMGKTKTKIGLYHQALESFDQARSAHNLINDKRGEALDLFESGIVLRNMGKYLEARCNFQDALCMFRETKNSDEAAAAGALGYLALIAMDEGDYEQAIRKAWISGNIYKGMSKWKCAAERMLDLALIYRARGELDHAEDRVRDAEQLYSGYQGDQDEQWQARFHKVRGLIRKDRGELMEAGKDLTLAYELFQRKTGNLRDEADVRAELAIVRHELGESGRSPLGELRGALRLHSEIGCPKGQAITLAYMGRVLSDQGETAEALKCSRQALTILNKRLKDQRGVAAAHQQIGMIQVKSGYFADADKSFRKACEIFKTERDQGGEACSLACRGVAKFLSGDADAARRLWKTGYELGKRARCDTSQSLSSCCLAGADAKPVKMPDALEHLKEAIKAKGSAPLARPSLELVQMVWKYQTSERKDWIEGDFCQEAEKFCDQVGDRDGWGDFAKMLRTRSCSNFAPF